MAAEAIFLRAIEAEPLVERLYLELMRVQASVGRSSDSEATYRRCREVLRNELGTAPSAELEAARRSACPPSSAVSSTRPSVTLDHPTERVSSAGRRHR
jgi:DNA-binding SARP family transcriptional activator